LADENAPLSGAVPVRKTRLQRLRWPLMSRAVVAVLGGGAYFYIKGSRYQSTDDAYAQAATVSISANVSGRASEIDVRDNELVQRGATLFRLDDAPVRIAVSDAAARLADTRLQIESLKSTYRQRLVELRAARDTQKFARQRYDRQTRLFASGIASQAQFDQAAHALDAARQQVISAPTDDVVAKVEQLQIGDTISASTPVFALVSARDVWIEANFKEVQLARMRPGQVANCQDRSVSGHTILGGGHERKPQYGFAVFAAAAGERDRQLGEGRPARARSSSAHPSRCWVSIASGTECQRDRRHAPA
jgi:membrane fusion protein, multidrug efflux system